MTSPRRTKMCTCRCLKALTDLHKSFVSFIWSQHFLTGSIRRAFLPVVKLWELSQLVSRVPGEQISLRAALFGKLWAAAFLVSGVPSVFWSGSHRKLECGSAQGLFEHSQLLWHLLGASLVQTCPRTELWGSSPLRLLRTEYLNKYSF